ncbi:MAG: PEP-CTERM sorting domain-containing protein [Sphingomonas sp.]|nr:PEP-CTERM sorting domain-containing protein [Sphingomonas sp.]
MQIDEDRFNIPGQGSTVVYNLFGWDSSTPGVGWRVTLTPTDQSNVSFTALPASNSLSSFSASSLFLYSNLPGQFVSLGGAYAPAIVVAETPTGESDFDPASIYAGRVSLFNEGSIISAKFSPGNGLSLSEAARSLGFDHFNWQQTLISADPLALPAILLAAHQSPPFFDPIPGGYSYNSGLNAYPYYYDSFNSFSDNGYNLAGHISADGKTLEFADQPNVPCLGGALAKNFCYSYFQTALVGVNTDGSLGSKLFEFAWKSNFSTDDAAGGVAILNAHPDVQLRGVGGVTLLSGKYFATAVPEPATWTMLSLGFGLIGYAMRRRPRRTVSVRCHSGCLQQ